MSFIKNIVTLVTGTAVAQAIPIAVSPILTRLYTPEEFGVLALFISITSIFAVIASLRYELAIMQPADDEDAVTIVILCFLAIGFIVFCCLLFAIANSYFEWNIFNHSSINKYLFLLPVSVGLTGLYNVLTYWRLRKNAYRRLSYARVAQGFSSAITQIGVGLFSAKGLILGQIIGIFSAFSALYSRREFTSIYKEKAFWVRLKTNALRYKRLPLLSSFGAFADTASLQMPIFLINRFFGEIQTGILGLTFRILNLPLSLMSASISQVFYKKVMDSVHQQRQVEVFAYTCKLFLGLLALIAPFCVFIYIWGEDLFAIVFGENWRSAGTMAKALVLAIAIRFAVSPLSTVLTIDKNVKYGVFWQVLYLFTISITLVYFGSSNVEAFILAFVIHEVVLYLLYLAIILKGISNLKGVS